MSMIPDEVAERLLESISDVTALDAVKLLLATAIVVASNTGITEEEVRDLVIQGFATKRDRRQKEMN